MTKVKLWITDVDGTIVDETSVFTEKMLSAIEKVKKSDTKMVIATGRMYDGAKGVADFLGLDTPIVCYQGAMIRHRGEIIHQAPLNNKMVREVIEVLREKNIHTNLYNNDKLIVEDDNKKMMEEYCHGRFTTYHVVKSFDEVELKNVSKMLAIVYDEDEMVDLINFMSKKYEGILKIVRSNKYYMEITDPKASKGEALKFLKNYWGIKKEEVLASGDQDNDFEMLEEAGIKVAMGNASEKLKQIADIICEPVNENGMIEVLERYVL